MDLSVFTNADPALPKYHAVKMTISSWIRSGELQPNEMIPTENALMDLFSVSRITIRRALSELTQEQLICRIQGKGSFVSQQRSKLDRFGNKSESYSTVIEHWGKVPQRVCLRKEMIPCEKVDAEVLGLHVGDPVLALDRIYYADGEPAIYVKSILNLKQLPGIDRYDICKESLFKVLTEDLGLAIRSKGRSIVTAQADAALAEVLHVEVNHPLLLLRYVSTMANGSMPWESARSYYRTEVVNYYLPDCE